VRSLVDAGVTVAASSDAPVVDASPLASMAAAVDRRGLAPAEAVDARTALGLVTRSAAAVSATGGGVLRAGGPAAFAVLDADPCVVGAERVSVLATVPRHP
jgi:predicted amidohydrolase YtcJ